MNSWLLALARVDDIASWIHGRVETLEDLYSSRIFGAKYGGRCDCGRLNGPELAGLYCQECGVWVTNESSVSRQRQLGVVTLACNVASPWAAFADLKTRGEYDWIFELPVAPIAYRVDGDGNPNALGKKYERLLALNTAAKLQLPPPGAQGYTKACEAFDKREIESVIAGIFGFDELRRLADSMPAESLSALLVRQLLELDPHISYVARAAFLKIHGSIDL